MISQSLASQVPYHQLRRWPPGGSEGRALRTAVWSLLHAGGLCVYCFLGGCGGGYRYEGDYLMDKMHGRGVYVWPDGAMFQVPARARCGNIL